jgi:hypothetical protein
MTMTEQCIRDYSYFIEPDRMQDFARNRREELAMLGDYVRIIDKYDGDDLISRTYCRSYGNDYGYLLDGRRASEDGTLNIIRDMETLTTDRK